MMTLTQTERLVRRIADSLATPSSDTHKAKLAQDYTELCRAASRRLEQCALMIEAGQFLQALQLAETAPPVLDLITLLSFRQSSEWRTHCQQHQLPWSEPFYDKYIRLLNDAYGKGISSDHPFYKDYRRAVLENNDARSFSILRVIAKLNPSDQNTKDELKRVEEKLLRVQLEKLRTIVDAGDVDKVQSALDQLEASGLPVPASHPAWQQAQVARCQQMLRRAEQFEREGQWQEAELLVEDIHALATKYNLRLPDVDADSWTALDEWTTKERTAYVADQDFRRAVSALQYEIDSLNTQRVSSLSMPAGKASAALQTLQAKRTEAERFGRPLPEKLAGKCDVERDWLQAQIELATRRRRIATAAVVVVVLVCLAAAYPSASSKMRATELDSHLAKLERERKISAVQALTNEVAAAAKKSAAMADTLAKANAFLSKEEGLRISFEHKLAALDQSLSSSLTGAVPSMGPERADCESALATLAPELQAKERNALNSWDEKLQTFRTQRIGAILPKTEETVASLGSTNSPEEIRAGLQRVASDLAGIAPMLFQPPNVPAEISSRLGHINEQANELKSAAERWDESQSALANASDLESYQRALDQLAALSLATSAQKAAAERIGRLQLSQQMILGQLLLPNDPTNWTMLTNAAGWNTSLMPEQPSSQEKDLYFKLRDDKNVRDVYAYELVANARANNPNRTHPIFVRGAVTNNNGGDLTGMVDDPVLNPDTLRFVTTTYSDWDFSQVRRLYRTLESDTYDRLGLGDLIDANTGNYQKPILQMFDQINSESRASAVFRAYVTFRLLAVAQLRPSDWGFSWCPALPAHVDALMSLGAADIRSGDWMVPERSQKYESRLQAYFDKARNIPMAKQAQFLQQLTHDACAKGFAFAGYCDPSGKPIVRAAANTPTEIYGWGQSGSATLLFKLDSGGAYSAVGQPLPYSPLFVFSGDRKELLEQSMRATGFPRAMVTPLLPPFFGGLL